jgi:hypothetical protein
MRLTLFILAGIFAASIAYSIGPDLVRYMKIRSM